MVIGCFYLTMDKPGAKGEGMIFCDNDEAKNDLRKQRNRTPEQGQVRFFADVDGERRVNPRTTVGRIIFNEAIPQDLGIADRSGEDGPIRLEVDYRVGKGQLSKIVDATFKKHGATETCIVLDNIKALGFKYSTIGAITTSVFDMHIPPEKKAILDAAEKKVIEYEKEFDEGILTEEEVPSRRRNLVAGKQRTYRSAQKTLDEFNPINMMAVSGRAEA
ncbi:MAG: hypothetical protein ACLUSP_09665 [Christensenellales bacterium]